MNTAPNQPPNPSTKALLSCIKHRSDPRFCPNGQKAASNDTTKPPITRAGSDWRRVCFLAWKMVSAWQECMSQCSLLAQPVPLYRFGTHRNVTPRHPHNKSPEKRPPSQLRMPVSEGNKQSLELDQLSYGIGLR